MYIGWSQNVIIAVVVYTLNNIIICMEKKIKRTKGNWNNWSVFSQSLNVLYMFNQNVFASLFNIFLNLVPIFNLDITH